ncbi:hypothetical protein P2318_29255 [Myxococcaceae bacterium GXIMD 01537]
MRTPTRILLLTAAALASGCGDSLFFVEAEVQEICKTEKSVTFPAALPGTASVQQTFELPIGDSGAALPEGTMDSDLRLKVFEVTATSGNVDLSQIESATVSIKKAGSTEAPIKLIEYRRPPNAGSLQKLSLTASAPVDVLELARQEQLDLTFEARGALPTQEWTASVRMCAGLRAKVDYFDLVF